MAFDADAFLAARSGWEVTLGGRTYRSAYVSIEQVMDFEKAINGTPAETEEGGQPGGSGPSPRARRAALRQLLRRMFPFRLEYIWLGDPVRRILGLDQHTRGKILADFFVWRLRVHGLEMPGTTSQTQTPRPTPATRAPLSASPS